MPRYRIVIAATGVLALLAVLASTASASVVPVRTLLISDPPGAATADGSSSRPALALDGRVVVFDTSATTFIPYDLNGNVRDIVRLDLGTGQATLVSAGGDGASTQPSVSSNGARVAFTSEATTFAPGDNNGASDVFIREGSGPVTLVSQGAGGGVGNGRSWDADISADGRYVVFTSAASNLVADDRNNHVDVFRRDLQKRETVLISRSSDGAAGNGPSGAAAISAQGDVVSFFSLASNLVPRDTNRLGDVFVRSVGAGRTARVSVATVGRQQNKSAEPPFVQVSDISANGRYVVFDSDATNLVARDENRRTDIFRHDRRRDRTTLISASSVDRQGNNDSFSPSMTLSGRFVAFQSFASNLAPGNVRGEDVFVRDLRTDTTTMVNVPATAGTSREAELVRQLLQRPAVSESGTRVAFTSTARNLASGDGNRFEDVFMRLLDPPRGQVVKPPAAGRRPSVEVTADDPQATRFLCRLDSGRPFLCPRGTIRVPARTSRGRHVLSVRAGGPGMHFDPNPLRIPVRVTR